MSGEGGQPGGLDLTLRYSGEFHRHRGLAPLLPRLPREAATLLSWLRHSWEHLWRDRSAEQHGQSPQGDNYPWAPKELSWERQAAEPPTSATHICGPSLAMSAHTHTSHAHTHGLRPREGCLLSPAPAPQGQGCSPTCSMRTTRARKRPPGTRLGTALTGRSVT